MFKPLNLNSISKGEGIKINAQKCLDSTPMQKSSYQTAIDFKASMKQDLVANNFYINELDNIIKEIDGLEGQEFADKAYEKLVKLFNLEGSAPEKITWMESEGRAIVGDYAFFDNSIRLYSDHFNKMDKATRIGIIAHELTHCKQLTNMLRTDGIRIEKIANAYATSDARAMLVNNDAVKKMYQEAVAKGKGKEFVAELIMRGTAKTTNELLNAHKNTLRMPKHAFTSPNGKKAQQDLIAQYNYNGADLKNYQDNPLEKEAMRVENIIKRIYISK